MEPEEKSSEEEFQDHRDKEEVHEPPIYIDSELDVNNKTVSEQPPSEHNISVEEEKEEKKDQKSPKKRKPRKSVSRPPSKVKIIPGGDMSDNETDDLKWKTVGEENTLWTKDQVSKR